jgi:hypothetical protein
MKTNATATDTVAAVIHPNRPYFFAKLAPELVGIPGSWGGGVPEKSPALP